MKRTLPIIILCFILSATATLVNGQNIPEVLYYKFNGAGTTVPNYASAPPPGTATATIMGGVTQGGTTLCQGSLIGTGAASTTDYLNTGWAPNLGAGSWTISFRTTGISTNATLYYIFGDINTASFRCFTNGVAGSTNWILRGAGLTDIYINGGALMTPTMCTFVYDNALANVKGYLNGVLVTTVAQGAVNMTGTGPLKVMGYSTNVGAPSGGLIDEFRFYSHALTAGEVAQLYDPYATPGFLGPDISFCSADTTQLDLIWPTSTVLWSDGSTADSLYITSLDTFSVTLSGVCGNNSDTVIVYSGATTDSIAPALCDTAYAAPSGAIYSVSGVYIDTIPNFVGCDSVITINLTLNSNTSGSANASICVGDIYTAPSGAMYSSAGTYMDTVPNFIGCDSVITINLTLNSANVSVSQTGTDGEDLMANAAIATYQWVNCPAMTPIAGATNQSYTATVDGMYAVIVTESGCTDTSACFTVAGLGISMNGMQDMIQLYPNPSKGQFTVDLGIVLDEFTIEITNNVGQVLQTKKYTNTSKAVLEITGAEGVYFIRITNTKGEKAILRMIKN